MATKPKELPDAEVLATHRRVVEALRAEGYNHFLDWGKIEEGGEQLPTEPGEPGTKVAVLLAMLQRTRAVRTRVLRARYKAQWSDKGGGGYQVFDDDLRDKAHQHLRTALGSVRNAEAAFEEHATKVERQAYPLRIGEPPERRLARVAREIASVLTQQIDDTRSFEGNRDIATASEWDELLSEFAVEMHAVGFSDLQIAEMLTNMGDAEAVDAINQRRRRRRLPA